MMYVLWIFHLLIVGALVVIYAACKSLSAHLSAEVQYVVQFVTMEFGFRSIQETKRKVDRTNYIERVFDENDFGKFG